jgi:pyocin large subunit-like protein
MLGAVDQVYGSGSTVQTNADSNGHYLAYDPQGNNVGYFLNDGTFIQTTGPLGGGSAFGTWGY